ncbi:hypothetical protein H072_6911 [Dactylellina haptotyla CBS 200.50]|uniref:Uncharacterized protein n=1 Tax=Dactylellina haptotyla (strain CBS 200.50) TaxID=1284197 RepID=S8A8E2_DACHA|nr:hypothetical protein H072_6911 [Dactylellina haptotyla CBS 200.50]
MIPATEIIIAGAAIAAFLTGMIAIEAIKSVEYLWCERKQRISDEIKYFGRPLSRKERKLIKKAHQFREQAARLVVDAGGGAQKPSYGWNENGPQVYYTSPPPPGPKSYVFAAEPDGPVHRPTETAIPQTM